MLTNEPLHTPAQNLEALARKLDQGAVVVGPTESSYAVIARIDRPAAIAKVIALKGRPAGKGMPVVVGDLASLAPWVDWPRELALLASLWPAALTLALPCRQSLPEGVLAPDHTLAVRLTSRADLAALARLVGVPLCVTSANRSTEAPAFSPHELPPEWLSEVVLWDVGVLPGGPPSTLVASQNRVPQILRQGAVCREHIEMLARRPEALSEDSLWQGALRLCQPRKGTGYRFNIDPVLLGGFVRQHLGRVQHALELGAGCGVLGLWLLGTEVAASVQAVERQPDLVRALACNVVANRYLGRLSVCPADLRSFVPKQCADLVVFNPPFVPAAAGRPSGSLGRDQARRELYGTLEDFVQCAARSLSVHGHMAAVIPTSRREAMSSMCHRHGLVVMCWQPVAARDAQAPTRTLVLAQRVRGEKPQGLPPILSTWITHNQNERALAAPFAQWVDGPDS